MADRGTKQIPGWIIMLDRYPYFFEETFLSEGYFQDDPDDKGNWYRGKLYGTICGITARDHFKEYSLAKELYDMKKFEVLKDYAMKFYRKKGYWKDGLNEFKDSSLAFKVFDFGVNAGTRTSIRLLQRTLRRYYGSEVEVNGVLTLETISEVNKYFYKPIPAVELIKGESPFYSAYVAELKRYYKGLGSFWKYGKGWLRRLSRIFNKTPDKVELSINARPPDIVKRLT